MSLRRRSFAIAIAVAIVLAAGVLGAPHSDPLLTGAVAGATGAPAAPSPSSSSPAEPPQPLAWLPPTLAQADPTPLVTPLPTPIPSGPFSMNLYERGDFVHQVTKKQCVSGAMQIMLNIVRPGADHSATTQAMLAALAKQLSEAKNHGTEPIGWARGLARLGAGRYVVAVEPTRDRAIRRAVIAIRETGRPVGLLVWRGAHSWVLHGFAATADPRTSKSFVIRGLYISDPWYPSVSSIWGPSRPPNSRVDPKLLPEDYLPWRRPTGRYPGMDGKFVLILPVLAPGEAPAA